MSMRALVSIFCIALAIAGCAPPPRTPELPPEPPPPIEVPAPTTTRGRFAIEADKNDTWNAVGQILVRTPGVTYEGRAQMLDLYSIRYRGEPWMILTRSLTLSDSIKKTTTEVTATTPKGAPVDNDAVAELLALLERELPAEIESVKAQFAAEKKAKEKAKKQKKKKSKK
ncbi:MAG: hypothetical protein H7Y19_00635 [Luteimonas sp.]|nr:hypothetical protein [Luteimonas sp.]